MTLLELNLVDSLDSIADHVPIHADELRKCANRVKAILAERDVLLAELRSTSKLMTDAAVLIQSQREELDALKVAQGSWP